MTIEMIPLNQIKPWDDNPRKSFDADTIEGLATSIKQDGLLQNLVVFKLNRKKKPYRLISGERRYRALSLLVERGDLLKDFEVPCDIREYINHSDAHRLATIENIQRENLTPLEEADAIAVLLQGNIDPQEVMAKTGLSLSTLKRRLALSGLCEEARIALCEKTISLAKAEALTLGSHDQQRDMLEREVAYFSADDIKHHLTYEKPSVALAIFKREEYQGSVTSDLFAEDETTYFDDEEEFWALQMKAVRALADEYREKGFNPVEIIEGYHFNSWEYREAEEG
ncbi:MAG: ParB/RepB/Spo0J family partition protein [Sneathiellales bacterium]|nr:ParB/RepB/Spo0J family partition protein [Sneathiellales bacterium]